MAFEHESRSGGGATGVGSVYLVEELPVGWVDSEADTSAEETLVKIGFTRKSLAARFKRVAGRPGGLGAVTANCRLFRPLLVMPGTLRDESLLHAFFNNERVRGEWFRGVVLDEYIGLAEGGELFDLAEAMRDSNWSPAHTIKARTVDRFLNPRTIETQPVFGRGLTIRERRADLAADFLEEWQAKNRRGRNGGSAEEDWDEDL